MSLVECKWLSEVTLFLADHPQVVLAFLFGSMARGEVRSNSDADFAVYLAPGYSDEDISSIWGRLEDVTHRDVDLIVLNSAPPGISWAGMKGQVLVDKNPRLHLELMLEKSAEAEDFRNFVMDLLRLRERWRDWNASSIS
jgi:predicted nucleotidyltransferase